MTTAANGLPALGKYGEVRIELPELRKQIREESGHTKGCFTQFSFQAIVFFGAAMGFVAQLQPGNAFAALASVPAVLIIRYVVRVGKFKYVSANRSLGYDLHVDRVSRLAPDSPYWHPSLLSIGWEEALRAWRIVQPTLLGALYHRPFPVRRDQLVTPIPPEKRWFEIGSLMGPGARYYSGQYLRRMTNLLHILMGLGFVPLVFMCIQIATSTCPIAGIATATAALATLGFFWTLLKAFIKDRRRIEMIEDGFFSIQTCAVIWQLTVVAHFYACRVAVDRGYDGYTRTISSAALELASEPLDLDTWLEKYVALATT